jgi:electron transfer flavoprotein alpha subunit
MPKKSLPKIDLDTCIGCSACVSACPAGVLEMDGDKAKLKDAAGCTSCGACVDSCPVTAIAMEDRNI